MYITKNDKNQITSFVSDSIVGLNTDNKCYKDFFKVNDFADGLEIQPGDSATEKGVFKYYLDDKGIVQQLVIEEQPEYQDYQSAKRAEEYRKITDGIFFKEQRGEVPAGTWAAEVEKIKNKIF